MQKMTKSRVCITLSPHCIVQRFNNNSEEKCMSNALETLLNLYIYIYIYLKIEYTGNSGLTRFRLTWTLVNTV